jgi:dTDP-glucose 4,6-dehydratase
VPNLIQQALLGRPLTIYGDGMQTRSFCYVDDLIDGIIRLLFSDEHQPVNIGNPVETTILEFAETINRIVGNKAGVAFLPGERLESDPQRRRPDITKARRLLGWEPRINLEEGLAKTIPYFRSKIGLA